MTSCCLGSLINTSVSRRWRIQSRHRPFKEERFQAGFGNKFKWCGKILREQSSGSNVNVIFLLVLSRCLTWHSYKQCTICKGKMAMKILPFLDEIPLENPLPHFSWPTFFLTAKNRSQLRKEWIHSALWFSYDADLRNLPKQTSHAECWKKR